ncbi:MAG: hypothetical protein AAB658_02620, partial [Chloroflexota bacterium]
HEIKVNGVGLVLTQLLGMQVATERQLVEWNTKETRPAKGQESFPDLWIVDLKAPKATAARVTLPPASKPTSTPATCLIAARRSTRSTRCLNSFCNTTASVGVSCQACSITGRIDRLPVLRRQRWSHESGTGHRR